MANAQVLVLVRSSADLSPGAQIQSIVENVARTAGFTPGPWSFNAQPVNIVQDPANPPPPSRVDNALSGIVSSGPWAGMPVLVDGSAADPGITRSGRREFFNTYRQNLLNGPAGSDSLPAAINTALRPVAGTSSRTLVSAMTNPAHRIPWDRDIPQAIAFSATSTSGGSGLFWGLLAIAGLAFAASRGSAAKMAFGKLSTNREGLTFEEWRRAAAVPASTPGVHAAWIKGEDPSDWRAMQRAATVASRARLSRGIGWR